jgi:hypothetical protein
MLLYAVCLTICAAITVIAVEFPTCRIFETEASKARDDLYRWAIENKNSFES